MKKIDWKIQRPSNVNLVGINEHKARALGEVIDLPITISSQELKVDALVTEKGDYDLILGNNWMHQHKAVMNWKKSSIQFEDKQSKINAPVTCLKRRNNELETDQFIAVEDSIEIKIFDDNGKGKLPEKAHETDAGFDLKYPEATPLTVQPKQMILIDSHIAIKVPTGTYCQLASRSLLVCKGIEIKAGTIDAGYTGNIGILLTNNSNTPYIVQPNEKIAQAIFIPLVKISNLKLVSSCDELGQTERNQQGFGSSDKTKEEEHKLEEDEFEYEEETLEDQPLLKIFEKQDEKVVLDFEIKENHIQFKDKQFYHSTFLEMLENEVTGFDKCPHYNDKLASTCSTCQGDDWFYEQLKIIPESTYKVEEEDKTDLNENQQQQINQLIEEYKDLFDISGPGRANAVQHEINTGNSPPIALKPYYRRSPLEREFMKEEIDRMLKQNIITPSDSPWSAPVVIAKKKDGKFRFCINYRQLNQITIKDSYPLPRIDDLLDAFGKAKYFTTLDLTCGYWHVEVKPEDRNKTAFTTHDGLYEFNVMPFGLTNGPATF